MNTIPYPSAEIRVVPRKRQSRLWLAGLAVTALILAALAWSPRAHPQPARHSQAAAVSRPQAAPAVPAKAGVTVTVGRTAYACTVAAKARH